MKSILIRNIDEKILSRLKSRARSHHRSLQGELHDILSKAAQAAPESADTKGLTIKMVRTEGRDTWSRKEVYGNKGR